MSVKKLFGGLIKLAAVGGVIGGISYFQSKKLKEVNKRAERSKAYSQLENQWIQNKYNGKSMTAYFIDNKINSIAIYGMGSLGELFYQEIKNSDIKVSYFIDKNADELYYGADDIKVTDIEGILDQEEVDAIIVTPVYDYEDISNELFLIGVDVDIISLEDIVYDL